MILKYEVKEENKTINEIISSQFHLSNRLFSKLLKKKMIFINKENIDTRNIAKIGDIIEINLEYEEENENIISKKMDLNIVFEDDGILVLDKPKGIAIHPSMQHFEDTISNGVKYYFESNGIYKKIRPVNRLDLNTSGLVVFAKNEYIQEELIIQMKNNIFNKEYVALVKGILDEKKGKIELPITRKSGSIMERCVSKDGKIAITEYEVLEEFKESSMVKCKLLTGRTHQIRVHFAYLGHPLIGDTLYGEKNQKFEGQFLRCYKILFMNPLTKKKVEIEIEKDF